VAVGSAMLAVPLTAQTQHLAFGVAAHGGEVVDGFARVGTDVTR
jgi:hypothetical protein